MIDFIKQYLDLNKLSYSQLKTAFIISLASIGAVYFIGQKTSEFKHTIDQTYQMTIQNTESIEMLNSQLLNIEKTRRLDYLKFYNDMVDMNNKNNKLWDNKFTLLIKYGDKNKGLLMELIEMENQKQTAINESFLLQQNYSSVVNYTDTVKHTIVVEKKKSK